MQLAPPANDGKPARWPLSTKILLGLGLGIFAGLVANVLLQSESTAPAVNGAITVAEIVGTLFLRLMFMVVLPLVFSALALAIAEIGDLGAVGRMGLHTLVYTAILSISAVLIGLVLVNTLQPGRSISDQARQRLVAPYRTDASESEVAARDQKAVRAVQQANSAKSIKDTIVDMLPENPLQEMVGALDGSSKGNGLLSIMVFSLIFGAALAARPSETQTVTELLRGLNSIAMTIIGWAMLIAPYGAGCLVFASTARLGIEIVITLAWFVATAVLGLGLHLFGTYSIVVWLFGGRSPRTFFRQAREAMLVAFGTSSSMATLPTAMRVAQDSLQVPPRIANFVLTVGATGNQNGTALFEGTVVLFLAQLMGVDLTLPQQATVVLMSILAGVGTAGVPGGSLPLIVVVLQSVGVPGPSIGIVLGVDRLLDMCRTTVNVTGDLVVTVCVDQSERRSSPTTLTTSAEPIPPTGPAISPAPAAAAPPAAAPLN